MVKTTINIKYIDDNKIYSTCYLTYSNIGPRGNHHSSRCASGPGLRMPSAATSTSLPSERALLGGKNHGKPYENHGKQ